MMNTLRTTIVCFALLLLLGAGAAPSAQALAMLDFTGVVNFADASNPWGIDTTSTINGHAEWDDSLLTKSGDEDLSMVFDDSTMSLTFDVGSFSFNSSDDFFFGGQWFYSDLVFGFEGGFLADIAVSADNIFDYLDITGGLIDNFFLGDGFDTLVTGALFLPDLTAPGQGVATAPVPEPGTFLLLGAGLGGLVLVRRRQKRA